MSWTLISESPIRHTYPYGKTDVTVPFAEKDELVRSVEKVFDEMPECRRVVVAVPQGDVEKIATCEEAGLRYVLDVDLRDGTELSLVVAEPDWVTSRSIDIDGLDLS